MYYNCFKVLVTMYCFTDKESIQILDEEQVFLFVEGKNIDQIVGSDHRLSSSIQADMH